MPVPAGKQVGDAFQLSNRAHGSVLDYFDFPGGQANGTVVDFVTCLISDYGNRKYHVLGGCFGWSIEITAAGDTDVTALADGAWSAEFAQEILDEFGFRLPASSGLVLIALGAAGLGAARRRRRTRQSQPAVPASFQLPGERAHKINTRDRRGDRLKAGARRNRLILVVPKGGLEPPHPCGHMTLNHARLPIPPLRRG